MCLQVNESLTQMYGYTQSFKLHIDWLKVAKENVSLPFQTEEGASSHLLQLSNLIEKCFHPVGPPAFIPLHYVKSFCENKSTEIIDIAAQKLSRYC